MWKSHVTICFLLWGYSGAIHSRMTLPHLIGLRVIHRESSVNSVWGDLSCDWPVPATHGWLCCHGTEVVCFCESKVADLTLYPDDFHRHFYIFRPLFLSKCRRVPRGDVRLRLEKENPCTDFQEMLKEEELGKLKCDEKIGMQMTLHISVR